MSISLTRSPEPADAAGRRAARNERSADEVDLADPSSFPQPGTGDDQPLPVPPDASGALYQEANQRVAGVVAQSSKPVSFARQMVQLALIPAIIVAAVLGVWAVVVSLSGRQMSVSALLDRVAAVPSAPVGSMIERPGHQERYRAAMTLLGIVDSDDLVQADRDLLITRLPVIARSYMDTEQELGAFLMGALGILSDPTTLSTFDDYLRDDDPDTQYAAAFGLCKWRGDFAALRSLTPGLVFCLNSQRQEARTLAALVLGSAADPSDMIARDALAQVAGNPVGESRAAAWNAGVALAALGDDRGTSVLLSLLDRAWLAQQPAEVDPAIPVSRQLAGTLERAAQDKVMATAINVAVVWDSAVSPPRHRVRVHDERVWQAIRQLAFDDPSEDIRTVARKALAVFESEHATTGESGSGG